MEYYDMETLQSILVRSASILGAQIEEDAAGEIARRSRGTPRIANLLLKRVRDFADIKGDGVIRMDIAKYGLEADNRILEAIIVKFSGGPVGLNTIATAVSEDAGTIEEVYEPYLIKEGFIKRTPRGREATPKAYEQQGKPFHQKPGGLFE
jgi:Holliday junction DNA helicase RuvB